MKKRLNIGLAVPYVDNEFTASIISGALLAAEKHDVNLFIIPVRYIKPKYFDEIGSKYKYQFTTMLQNITPKSLDGIIIETGSIGSFVSVEEMAQAISSFKGMPVITLTQKTGNYSSIRFNCEGLKEAVRHIINVHGKTKLAFISGPSTNEDSILRFKAFREVLDEFKIPFSNSMYTEGDMSEFCHDAVNKILDSNPNGVEAIFCANDRMTIAVYEVLNERGIEIGKDIAVIGYDDAPSASGCKPKLTTVHTDVPLMGYNAVKECIKCIKTGVIEDTILDSSMMIRESCGCKSFLGELQRKMNSSYIDDASWTSIRKELLYLLSEKNSSDTGINALLNYYDTIIDYAVNGGDFELSYTQLHDIYNGIDFSFVSFEAFLYSLKTVRNILFKISEKKGTQKTISKIIEEIYKFLILDGHNSMYLHRTAERERSIKTSDIIGNVLAKITDYNECYYAICSNLKTIGITASAIFINEKIMINKNIDFWKRPEQLLFMCYFRNNELHVIDENKRLVNSDDIFRLCTFDEKNSIQLMLPLYYNEENYGIMLCVTDADNFQFLTCVAHDQINLALKMKQLTEEQIEIHKQLRKNIEQIQNNNEILSDILITDELTGIMNRRGFIQYASDIIKSPVNKDKKAIIVFIDMNNLKKINDSFGHENGDFSLKSIAAILKMSFRSCDIIARIGGDEFAALALVNAPDLPQKIRKRIKESSEKVNSKSNKPYNITVSVGVHEFICSSETSLSDIMNKADESLYEEKKNKPLDFLK